MKQTLYIFFLIFICSCSDQSNHDNFSFDPTIPYPLLNPGDFWLDKFDERGLQNGRVYNDDLFCNTINVRGDTYLYCFDLKSGKVKWRAKVHEFATQPITKQNETIIYCSFLGEFQVFDITGKEIWTATYDKSYAGHWVDPSDSKIKVKGVIGSEIRIYNINGDVDTTIKSFSLKKKIDKLGRQVDKINKRYRLAYKGWKYDIDVSTPQNKELNNIEIKKYR